MSIQNGTLNRLEELGIYLLNSIAFMLNLLDDYIVFESHFNATESLLHARPLLGSMV